MTTPGPCRPSRPPPYERAGPWVTAAGVVMVVVAVGLATRWLRLEAERG